MTDFQEKQIDVPASLAMTSEAMETAAKKSATDKSLSTVWNVAKWLIMALAVIYLWQAGALSSQRLRMSGNAFSGLAAALAALALSTACMSVRFHCLLRCLNAPSLLPGQVKVNFSGLLVQQIGSDVGFDAMRLIAAKRMGGRGADVFAAVMVDRLLGLLALSILAVAGLSLFWDGTDWVVAALLVAVLLAAIPAAFVACHYLAARPTAARFARLPGVSLAAGIGGSLLAFRSRVPALLGLLMLSATVHACTFTALYFCGAALANVALTADEALTAGALSSFTTMIPLPMAGLGVGEAAFGEVVAKMRGVGEAAEFASIFLVNRFLLLFLGAVAWLWLSLTGNGIKQK